MNADAKLILLSFMVGGELSWANVEVLLHLPGSEASTVG